MLDLGEKSIFWEQCGEPTISPPYVIEYSNVIVPTFGHSKMSN